MGDGDGVWEPVVVSEGEPLFVEEREGELREERVGVGVGAAEKVAATSGVLVPPFLFGLS